MIDLSIRHDAWQRVLVHTQKKDLARPQHRIIMLFITNSLIGNVPNVQYTSNMTIYTIEYIRIKRLED